MGAKTRRLENNLMTVGTGVAAFGVWALVKYILTAFVLNEEIEDSMEPSRLKVIYIFVFSLTLLDFLMRCLIGFSARAEGKGKNKGVFYLVITVLLILIYAFNIVVEIIGYITFPPALLTMVVTLLIDVTSAAMLVELFVSSVKLRKLRRLADDSKGGTA